MWLGSVAQFADCSQSLRKVLGLSPGLAMCCFPPLWHLCVNFSSHQAKKIYMCVSGFPTLSACRFLP